MEVAVICCAALGAVVVAIAVTESECNEGRKKKRVQPGGAASCKFPREDEDERMMQLALLQSVQVEQERVDRLEEEELQQALELSLTEASKGNLLSPRPVMNCGASSSDNGTASTTEA